ncbi:MAG: YvcK family protein [bacterium]|nr:YvcK family protein [bacterium]
MKNIVIIGGGTGTFTLLSGLRKFPTNNSVIVSSADDGGSTGKLRAELGVMPPGDIRQCLVGLSYTDETLRDLFNYRFDKGTLNGHSLGNIIIAGLEKSTGSIEKAIIEAARLLNVRGQVVPVTLYPTQLTATLENGKKIVGEHNIDEPSYAKASEGTARIKSLSLRPNTSANPRAFGLIESADVIIFGPGDLYTSTIPNLLPKGMATAIKKSKAMKVLVVNIMTKWGQTHGFKASDFVRELEKYLTPAKLDVVIVNTQKPKLEHLSHYKKEKAEFVENDLSKITGIKVIARALLDGNSHQKNNADVLKRSLLRHDSDKLAKVIYELL